MDRGYYKVIVKNMEKNILSMQNIALNSRTMNEKLMWDNLINEEMYKRCIVKEFASNMEDAEKLKEL